MGSQRWNAVTLDFLFSWSGSSAQKIKNRVQLVTREETNLRIKFYLRDVTDAVTL